jgi:MtN3 and saliva related transmembrane protein
MIQYVHWQGALNRVGALSFRAGTVARERPPAQREVGTNKAEFHCRAMITAVGLFAAFCTTLSYFPQLKKCWETNSAGDLSLKMFLILTLGVATWIFYGYLQGDSVIIIAKSVSLCLLLGILYFKLREGKAKPG